MLTRKIALQFPPIRLKPLNLRRTWAVWRGFLPRLSVGGMGEAGGFSVSGSASPGAPKIERSQVTVILIIYAVNL